MKDIKLTITIDQPVDDVFDFVINPHNTPKWVDGVVTEHTNETPTRLGTIYRNRGQDNSWAEFEITDFQHGVMFEMTKKGDNAHVQYMLKPLGDRQCELEYYVYVDEGDLDERFSQNKIQNILQNLKEVMEKT